MYASRPAVRSPNIVKGPYDRLCSCFTNLDMLNLSPSFFWYDTPTHFSYRRGKHSSHTELLTSKRGRILRELVDIFATRLSMRPIVYNGKLRSISAYRLLPLMRVFGSQLRTVSCRPLKSVGNQHSSREKATLKPNTHNSWTQKCPWTEDVRSPQRELLFYRFFPLEMRTGALNSMYCTNRRMSL